MSVDAEKNHDSLVRMRDYCERIAFHMHRFGGKKEFLEDWAYQDACVMILAQIGEEAKKIEPWLNSNSDYPWKDVIRFRDFAYHTYPATDYNIIWEIISEDVPRLLNILADILYALDDDPSLGMPKPKRKSLFGGRR